MNGAIKKVIVSSALLAGVFTSVDVSAGLTSPSMCTASSVVRTISNNGTLSPSVALVVTPDMAVSAYAVEETLPSGLTPDNISGSGTWDSTNRKVKWGPFFDNSARTLTYEVTGSSGTYTLNGVGSFDGASMTIGGANQITIGGGNASAAVRVIANNETATPDVSINVTPALSVSSYAVEESLPASLVPTNMSHNGTWDSSNRKVKWGPFFDNTARTLTYEIVGPDGTYTLNGVASFDGASITISGANQITVGVGTPPNKVTNPIPANGAHNVGIDTSLSWQESAGATSYDVYFGTDATPDSSEFRGNQINTTFNPGSLSYGATYYWRIDAKNAYGTTTGEVWSFTTALPAVGASHVVIEPQAACDAGAQWRVDGGAWQNSGAIVGNLSAGSHLVQF